MRILFVDDEDDVRDSFHTLLNMWSKEAYSASNGKEGLELYKKYTPDIVVTDIKMPLMSGLEMIENLRKISPSLPIVITTAHQEPELLLEAIEYQVDAYIVKPIPKKELKRRLNMMAKILLFEKSQKEKFNILKTTLESSIEAMLIFKNSQCIDANSKAMSLLGYRNKDEICSTLDIEKFIDILKNNKEQNIELCDIDLTKEFTIVRDDSQSIPVLIKCTALDIAIDDLKIVVAVDLSDIKKLENESRKKDFLIFQQSKMAAMGEMIGNIAHQWKQPLSVISMDINNIRADYELGELKSESILKCTESTSQQLAYLSKTIDDFMNFFKPSKDSKDFFNLKNFINKSLSLVWASFYNNHIKTIVDIDDSIEIYSDKSQLSQAILNILNNAKDALKSASNIDKRFVFIKAKEDENQTIITIKDNANGISNDIINNIFEPYFTTKGPQRGTGLGLYITHTIITKHLNGTIDANNVEFEFEGINYKGASFTIRVPNKKI
jgi:signal transduction histidine kinase/AmiR/NasT family two-component response regulator